MFCYKCGTELTEGVRFCPKCGAKLISDDIQQQVVASISAEPVQQMQQSQQQIVPVNIPKKKQSAKLPLVIGAGMLAVIVAVFASAWKLGRNSGTEQTSSVNLSETYINEVEGISFQYPNAWKVTDVETYFSDPSDIQASVILLVNDAGDEGLISVIEVLKFSSFQYQGQGAIDYLFISDEEFAATFDDDVSIIETSLVEIDGIEARKIAYIEQDELYYLSYFYGIDNTLYRVNFICHKDQKDSLKRFFDAVIESYTITTKAETPISSNTMADDSDYSVFAEALWNLIMYNTLPNGEIANDLDGEIDGMWDKFAICDINRDGVSELLIKIGSGSEAAQGQYIYQLNSDHTDLEMLYSFFTNVVYYDTGFIREDWSHNQGLSENFWPYNILQWELDGCREVAGADAWEKMSWETDFSGNVFPDKVDTDGNGIVYFIGGENGIDYDNPVDDAEYNAFVKNFFGAGNEIYVPWRDITEENIENTTGYTMVVSSEPSANYGDLSVNISSGFSEPLEYYSKFSGLYEGSGGLTALSVSIFSSQGEGEISIGNIILYVDGEEYYYGEIIGEIERDMFVIEGYTGEAVVLDAYTYGGTIVMDLYVDGEYLEEFWMVEHYVS